ncbi:hypothetical protein HPP92_023198 [Vanilla planifolia]|uniref:Uncharacterized protein n=1 Tax=Vanilla planifolia TaxID=51239 RepID=A0A835PTD0_VANPL|nr:hypothetical protein HPP92_023198 [Vanilla planifolia]
MKSRALQYAARALMPGLWARACRRAVKPADRDGSHEPSDLRHFRRTRFHVDSSGLGEPGPVHRLVPGGGTISFLQTVSTLGINI